MYLKNFIERDEPNSYNRKIHNIWISLRDLLAVIYLTFWFMFRDKNSVFLVDVNEGSLVEIIGEVYRRYYRAGRLDSTVIVIYIKN